MTVDLNADEGSCFGSVNSASNRAGPFGYSNGPAAPGDFTQVDPVSPTMALCMFPHYYDGMGRSITIRNVPDETGDELAARAALTGRSLQEYLRVQLIELAQRPAADVLIARIRARKANTGSTISTEAILTHLEADRR